MKNYKYISLLFITVILSCSKFDEINKDPYASDRVPEEMLAAKTLIETFKFWNPNPFDFSTGNLWNKHIAWTTTWSNPYQYYYSWWPYGGFGYKRLTDLKLMVEYSREKESHSSYQGLEKFMKAWYGFSSTLEMGDIPYSEAGMADEGILRPKYDKQEDVFKYILEDLKKAEAFFAEGKQFQGDVMFDGDASKWQKLCNAMQLKVLQTMSKKAGNEHKARFAEIIASGKLMTGNTDNFQLRYFGTDNSHHPFWNGASQRRETVLTNLLVDELKKNKDRRLFYFADPAPDLIAAGKREDDFEAYAGADPTRVPWELADENNSYSHINQRYVDDKTGDPMLRFTYAEQCFIIAEGLEEEWAPGNAKDYYEKGVKAMLEYYMNLPSAANTHGMAITQDYIDNYFTGEAAYKTGGTKQDRLRQILVQRWFIDFFQGNGGNYAQFLRTGYPEYPLDPATSQNPDDKTVYPKRWKYPEGEHTQNPDNYQKAVNEQFNGYDGINGVPWYLK